MPSQPICDMDHVELAEYIIGHVKTGDQAFLCESHMVPWLLAWLDERLDDNSRRLLAAHFLEGLEPAHTQSPTPAPASPRTRGRRSPPVEAEEPAATQETEPATTDGG